MSHTLFELDIRLREIQPPIWRTVEVPGACSLEDVHYALQVAMGWTNSHLHQFVIGKKSYGMVDVENEIALEDERQHRLQDVVRKGDSFVYEYDFGDSWEHEVTVKKVTSVARSPLPRCVAGARACPPEDCGGVGGYEDLLEALADPDHKEHESLVTWSSDFQPEQFELPGHGRDLRAEMENLRALAAGDDPDADHEIDADDGPAIELPEPLVHAVLALDPMKRASLAALIAGSLATELLEIGHAAAQLMATTKGREKKKTGRARRKRSRS